MVFPFCLASTLRVAKLLPSRKRLTSYMMGTARELSEENSNVLASKSILRLKSLLLVSPERRK